MKPLKERGLKVVCVSGTAVLVKRKYRLLVTLTSPSLLQFLTVEVFRP